MRIDTGLDIEVTFQPLGFQHGTDMFGPEPELRSLDAIRPSLLDFGCSGPDPVYAIAMDVGRPKDRRILSEHNLLFGVVAFAAGRLGREPVRSQGHVHKGSTPEIFEIWQGRALIYMQEFTAGDPGRCFAVEAAPRDRVVVPPGWAHAVISADPRQPLVFGAWCARDYGFVYDAVRAHGGLAWFPLLDDTGFSWRPNHRYQTRDIALMQARKYPELGLDPAIPLYAHLDAKPGAIQWISHPELWPQLEPTYI